MYCTYIILFEQSSTTGTDSPVKLDQKKAADGNYICAEQEGLWNLHLEQY